MVIPREPVLLLGLYKSSKVGRKENKAVDRDPAPHLPLMCWVNLDRLLPFSEPLFLSQEPIDAVSI